MGWALFGTRCFDCLKRIIPPHLSPKSDMSNMSAFLEAMEEIMMRNGTKSLTFKVTLEHRFRVRQSDEIKGSHV